jgi:hypothetical protein
LLNSVILNYNDPDAIDHFTILLFASGIAFGIGSSVLTTAIYDGLKERRNKAQTKHKQNTQRKKW